MRFLRIATWAHVAVLQGPDAIMADGDAVVDAAADTDTTELKKRESELKEKALRNKVVRSRKTTDPGSGSSSP